MSRGCFHPKFSGLFALSLFPIRGKKVREPILSSLTRPLRPPLSISQFAFGWARLSTLFFRRQSSAVQKNDEHLILTKNRRKRFFHFFCIYFYRPRTARFCPQKGQTKNLHRSQCLQQDSAICRRRRIGLCHVHQHHFYWPFCPFPERVDR